MSDTQYPMAPIGGVPESEQNKLPEEIAQIVATVVEAVTEALQEDEEEHTGPFGLPCGHTIPERRSGPVWCGPCQRWWPIPQTAKEMAVYGQTKEQDPNVKLPGQGPLHDLDGGYRTA